MRLFLRKMHNIWIQIFQLIFFKFSSASFKTNITFCYLAFKIWVVLQRVAQKCTLRRLALAQLWLFISYTRKGLPNRFPAKGQGEKPRSNSQGSKLSYSVRTCKILIIVICKLYTFVILNLSRFWYEFWLRYNSFCYTCYATYNPC